MSAAYRHRHARIIDSAANGRPHSISSQPHSIQVDPYIVRNSVHHHITLGYLRFEHVIDISTAHPKMKLSGFAPSCHMTADYTHI
jgi:hypothetical protein